MVGEDKAAFKLTTMENCNYCPDPATSICNEEYLCSRHYRALYLKKTKAAPLRTVFKTREEARLKRHYVELFSRPQTAQEFSLLVIAFKADAARIVRENPLYRDLIH